MSSSTFQVGERVLLIDGRGRKYMIVLASGREWHSHLGALSHDEIIGLESGSEVVSVGGSRLLALRPSLSDYVLKMRRGAQVVYPKDIGLILVYADIFPGATVVEAGTGSGSLTLALARAVGEGGRVISYEAREDHLEQARANIAAWYEGLGGKPENLDLLLGDVFEEDPGCTIDRLVLDLPEPWRAVGATTRHLVPGGIMCAYVPTVVQVIQTAEAMRAGGFGMVQTLEGLVRTWNVEGQSVRPDHRMVAHTGFIIFGRKLAGPR